MAGLIRATADLKEDLAGAMGSWAFCLRVSVGFYLLLTLATLVLVSAEGIRPAVRLEFRLAIAKDCLLLFIIASMLYLGLFRLAAAHKLAAVFRSVRGFVEFMIVCGLIAILAIWADFNSTTPQKQELSFYYQWQKTYNTAHVFVRDIALLLMPIAGLLYWTLLRVGKELRRDRREEASAGNAPSRDHGYR